MAMYAYPIGKMGDKSTFWRSKDGLMLLAGWKREGLFEGDICKRIGINQKTLGTWKAKYPEIAEALLTLKYVCDEEVTNALFSRARGMTYKEVTKELVEGQLLVTKEVSKFVPPDVTACLAWLNNKRGDIWRAKQADLDTMEKDIMAASQVLVNIRVAAGNESTPVTNCSKEIPSSK